MQYEVYGNPQCLKISLFEESLSVREGRVIYKTERINVSSVVAGSGEVGIASDGRIKVLRLAEGDDVFVCEESWLAYESSIVKESASGILARFRGPGVLFIEAYGNFVDFLLEEGEGMEVYEGNLVALDATVTSENRGELIYVVGPGAVMVQTHRKKKTAGDRRESTEDIFGNIFGGG